MEARISCSITFPAENRTVYEMVWKDMVEPDRPQMTVRRMRCACWIPRSTNTHTQYAILIAFPLQQWLHEHCLSYQLLATVSFLGTRLHAVT